MKRLLILSLLLWAAPVFATDYYIRTDGNDNCDGLQNVADTGTPWSSSCAWLTIGKANTTLTAGDMVTIGAGTYRETINPTNEGTAGNLITYKGATGTALDVKLYYSSDLDATLTQVVTNPFNANPLTNVWKYTESDILTGSETGVVSMWEPDTDADVYAYYIPNGADPAGYDLCWDPYIPITANTRQESNKLPIPDNAGEGVDMVDEIPGSFYRDGGDDTVYFHAWGSVNPTTINIEVNRVVSSPPIGGAGEQGPCLSDQKDYVRLEDLSCFGNTGNVPKPRGATFLGVGNEISNVHYGLGKVNFTGTSAPTDLLIEDSFFCGGLHITPTCRGCELAVTGGPIIQRNTIRGADPGSSRLAIGNIAASSWSDPIIVRDNVFLPGTSRRPDDDEGGFVWDWTDNRLPIGGDWRTGPGFGGALQSEQWKRSGHGLFVGDADAEGENVAYLLIERNVFMGAGDGVGIFRTNNVRLWNNVFGDDDDASQDDATGGFNRVTKPQRLQLTNNNGPLDIRNNVFFHLAGDADEYTCSQDSFFLESDDHCDSTTTSDYNVYISTCASTFEVAEACNETLAQRQARGLDTNSTQILAGAKGTYFTNRKYDVNDYTIPSSSPLVDAGDPTVCSNVVVGSACDAGIDESSGLKVEQWHRTTIQTGINGAQCTVGLSDDEVQFEATFTHTNTATTITMPGYYDVTLDEFVVDFMPTLLGEWTWITDSVGGALTLDAAYDCFVLDDIPSTDTTKITGIEGYLEDGLTTHPGQLEPDGGGKWRYSESLGYVVPLGLRSMVFYELEADVDSVNPVVFDANDVEFTRSADYLDNMNFQFFETLMYDDGGIYDLDGIVGGAPERYDYAFCCGGSTDWQLYDMDNQLWDRFARRLDILTARGLGIQIMPFTDFSLAQPGYCGLTGTVFDDCVNDSGRGEGLLIRHMVARTAAHPHVVYDYAIDYNDMRSDQDAVDYVARVKFLDPYDHPVSARHKAEVGGSTEEPAGQTYDSEGAEDNPLIVEMLGKMEQEVGDTDCDGGPCSLIFTDSFWEESYSCIAVARRSHPEVARRAAWKSLMVGGAGAHFRGGDAEPCLPNAACSNDRSEWFYWPGDDGTGNSCLNEVEFYVPSTLEGVKEIKTIVENDLGVEFTNMRPNPSTIDNTTADVTAAGDIGEYCLFDQSSPDIILCYATGQDDEAPTGGHGEKCGTCDGEISIDLTHGDFTGYTYDSITWINPRTGVRSAATPSSIAAGGTQVFQPPSDLSNDWALLLTTGGGVAVCGDGIDNDGDGLTDFPADPGCTSSADADERGGTGPNDCNDGAGGTTTCPACDDTSNNDNDPHTDSPDDPGCADGLDVSELSGQAGDSSDLPSCTGACDCDDNIDNDTDTFTDFNADSDCASATDDDESTPTAIQCDDNIDNDGDGFTDFDGNGGDPDIGCDDAADTTEGSFNGGVSPWNIPCTDYAWFQTVDDINAAGGNITVTFDCAADTVISVDKDHAEYANELTNGSDSNTIGSAAVPVIFELDSADQWRNRDVCETSTGGDPNSCDPDSDGQPEFCPQCSDEDPPVAGGCASVDENNPRFLMVRSDNNTFQYITIRWYADGITFDNGEEANGNVVDNFGCEYPGDNCFRNEGDNDNDGTDDASAYNNTIQNSTVLNACDKSFQQQGQETGIGAHATTSDYDMILDNVTCTNCNQGLRATFEGRYKLNNSTWVADVGQIPAGTGAGLYTCDSAIRLTTANPCGGGSRENCASLVRVTGNTSLSGCTDNTILVEDYGQVIIEGTSNAVFQGSDDAFEVRNEAKLSVSGTAIQNNNQTGIFWNSLTATTGEADCGGGSITFTTPDGTVDSTGGNTFSSNEVWDVRNLSPGVMSCTNNTFDCPQPDPNPKVDGSVLTAPIVGTCSTEPAGSILRGVKLDGVKMP